jgi:DNA repair exonuclease SbcCD nuclease subunit
MLTFIADLHLSLNNRIWDFKKVLMEQILPEANKSTKFYILGDIFHDRRPHPVELNIFRDFISQIKVPTNIISGNHDENLDATTIDEFTYYDTNVQVYRPPLIELCEGLILYLDHAQYEGAKLGPSNLNLNIREAKKLKNLPVTTENNLPIDFYVFGHIHKAQILRNSPPTLYVGSIERIDFAERNEDKFMFQIDEKTKKYGYKKLDIRPMYQLGIELASIDKCDFKLAFVPFIKNAILKIVIEGTKEQISKFNEAPLLECLRDSYKYSISYNIVRDSKVNSKVISEEKTSIECFKDFAKFRNFSEIEITKGIGIINEC